MPAVVNSADVKLGHASTCQEQHAWSIHGRETRFQSVHGASIDKLFVYTYTINQLGSGNGINERLLFLPELDDAVGPNSIDGKTQYE